MSSDEVRLRPSYNGTGYMTHDGGDSPVYIALPAAEFHNMASKARAYEWTLAALKSEHNRAMPFGQVMADLGLDQPPGDAVEIRVRYESGAVRALTATAPERQGEAPR